MAVSSLKGKAQSDQGGANALGFSSCVTLNNRPVKDISFRP
jgi:hypothetical protein